jgi:dsRNA-specific ribonuclease
MYRSMYSSYGRPIFRKLCYPPRPTRPRTFSSYDSSKHIEYLYNPNNKMLMPEDLANILQQYGLPGDVNSMDLYRQAFLHSSCMHSFYVDQLVGINAPISKRRRLFCNSSIEFVGDSVLELLVRSDVYRRFPEEPENILSLHKLNIVSNDSVGKIALEMGLGQWLVCSKDIEDSAVPNIRTNRHTMACALEAFIGAIYLDTNNSKVMGSKDKQRNQGLLPIGPGLEKAQTFVGNMIDKHVDWSNIENFELDHKSKLIQLFQKAFPKHFLRAKPLGILELDRNEKDGYTVGAYMYAGQPMPITANDPKIVRLSSKTTMKMIEDHVDKHQSFCVLLSTGTDRLKKKADQLACKNAYDLLTSTSNL